MPFTAGVFANVAGATSAAAGQTVQSATWNAIHADYSEAFNEVAGQLAATPAYRNILWMNGGLEIWQRGAGSSASISVAASTVAYTADRWYLATDTNQASVVSAQAALSNNSSLCARVQRNAAQTGTGVMRFAYPLSLDDIFKMRGKLARLRFIIRAGANWSPTSGTISAILYVGTGAAAKRNATPYTSETSAISTTSDLTAGGSTTTVTANSAAVIPVATTQAELQISWTPVGTAGASDYFEIDDVQIEIITTSDSANYITTEFEYLPFDVTLAGCKRYYQKSFPYSVAAAAGGGVENALSHSAQATSLVGFFWMYQVEMRIAPTLSKYHVVTATGSNWYNLGTSVTIAAAFRTTVCNTKVAFITGITASAIDNIYLIHADADASI